MSSGEQRHGRFAVLFLRIVLPALAVAGAVLGAMALVASKPDAARAAMEVRATPVEVLRLRRTDFTVEVEAMGQVIPVRRVDLRAQVGGRVLRRHPALESGGRFAEGEPLLEIEREDYEAALAEAESVLAQALLNEALELQRQTVAAAEWRQSGQTAEDQAGRAIALREPYVEAARRAVSAAREGSLRATRNLERTVTRAPFDGIVLKVHSEAGSVLAPQGLVAEIAATDAFYIQAALPMDSLEWLNLDTDAGGALDPPPAVRITVVSGGRTVADRTGRAVRLTGELTRPGLMAGILVEVEDPLDAGRGLLPLGAYARCMIEGRRFRDVFPAPRSAIRDNDALWVAGDGDRLQIRSPALAWKGKDIVLISEGVDEGSRIIVTALPVAAEGMPLKVLAPDGAQP